MPVWAAVIGGVINVGLQAFSHSQSPSYPSPPQLNSINVPKAQNFMEAYEAKRMGASVDAWKQRFPLLYQGGQYLTNDLINNQAGMLSPNVKSAIQSSGLEVPVEGDQYKQAKDLGLNPITLAQRTSEAATRQIAQNPEWTNKVSGGTLATLMANNYQNQNAYSQFLGAQQTAQYIAGQNAQASNTQALLTGLAGTAKLGYSAWYNQQQSPFSLGGYAQGNTYGSQPNYTPVSNPLTNYPFSGSPPGQAPGSFGATNMWGAPTTYNTPGGSTYGNSYDFTNMNLSPLFQQLPSADEAYMGIPGGY